jgi:hypothetical protein
VVIQNESRRFSADLSADLDEVLQETPVGRLTPPEDNAEGIVMIAVCNKREVRSDADARRDVESELRNEEGLLLSRGYLRDLRASATIMRPTTDRTRRCLMHHGRAPARRFHGRAGRGRSGYHSAGTRDLKAIRSTTADRFW